MDITRYRGDTYPDEMSIVTSAGAAQNITGFTFVMTLNRDEFPTDATNQVYQLNGTITDAANGLVEFAPSAVQADQVGTLYYDVQMTDAGGAIKTIQTGKYIYLQNITK